jgi:hypothetical protein
MDGQNLIAFPGGVATPNYAPAGPVTEANIKLVDPTPAYVGIRYVFNVIDSTHVEYFEAKRYVGFENMAPGAPNYAAASAICSGQKASTIENYGFGTLDTTVGPNNLLASTCRLYTP